jgi:hypothetical protein
MLIQPLGSSTVTAPAAAPAAPGICSGRFPGVLSSRRWATLVAACAMGLAIYLKLLMVLPVSFPLNDGGLFYLMTRELQANGYALPTYTSYNHAGIPFAYPPLGFYLLAGLSALPGADMLEMLTVLPAVLSLLTVPAFLLLSRSLLRSSVMAATATLAFALLPRTHVWFVMGGGLTRSLGFLLVLLMLWSANEMYLRRQPWLVLATALLGALAVASHLENAWFGAYSAALLLLRSGRHRSGVRDSAIICAAVLALTAPWWYTVVREHGLATFRYVMQASGQEWNTLSQLTHFDFTGEPFLPVLGVLGLLGVFVALAEGRPFLPIWLVTIFLVNPRNPATPATVPLALLVALTVHHLLVPGALAAAGGAGWLRDFLEHRLRIGDPTRALALQDTLAVGIVLLPLLGYTGLGTRSAVANTDELLPLPGPERAAMRWVAASTDSASRFVVVAGRWFGTDPTSEWFPVLTRRVSVATVQGYEWLPGRQFTRRWELSDALRDCSARDAGCLNAWARRNSVAYTHLFVVRDRSGPLLASLRESPAHELVYDQGGVAVFRRR